MWRTIHIFDDLRHQRVPEYRVPTFFAIDPDELAFVAGPVQVDAMRADGDGSYVHSSTIAFGTGPGGWALAAGSIAGSAIANANRRARALADARVTWRPEFGGGITVTNRGFYLQTQTGIHRWTWDSIDLMQIEDFNVLVLQGRSTGGPVTWRMVSHWSELVFLLWAGTRHPQHPQFAAQSWVPTGWTEWAASMGYPPIATADGANELA